MVTKKKAAPKKTATRKAPPKKAARGNTKKANVKSGTKKSPKITLKATKALVKPKATRRSAHASKPTAKQLEVADLWFGGPDEIRGNAGKCYKFVYPRAKVSTADTEGPRLLRKPHLKAYLAAKAKRVQEITDVNAAWVLTQSVRVFEMTMGDRVSIHEKFVDMRTPDGEIIRMKNGQPKRIKVHEELCNTAELTALRALEVIGKNVAVQAFKDVVEVNENHNYLVEVLDQRTRKVEAAAAERMRLVGGTDAVAEQ